MGQRTTTPLRALTVCVVTFNSDAELLDRCLSSVAVAAGAADLEVDVVVVDNGSATPPDLTALGSGLDLVPLGDNVGFARAANIGVGRSTGDHVLLLNPDAALHRDALVQLRAAVEDAGRRRLYCGGLRVDDTLQVDAFWLWWSSTQHLLRRDHWRRYFADRWDDLLVPVDKVCGGALFAERSLLLELGPFDERFFLYCEDADLSLRARRAGVELLACPRMVVHHVAASSTTHYSGLVERARTDAILRLNSYHRGRWASVLVRLEQVVFTLVGAVLGGAGSTSSRARLQRLREIRRWGLRGDVPPFSP